MKRLYWLLILLAAVWTMKAQDMPKREFRGAWIQCVNGQFQAMPTKKMQDTLRSQLDKLHEAGINAIIFQVRPEADALYFSDYEPWSRYLTGEQGIAPDPLWDPLQFMIEECHRRGMELHAWINPYRARTKGTKLLAHTHPAARHPERFVAYDGQLFFNPGLPENRKYICQIVKDIVSRYDVDGLHMDDYFYPYPVKGVPFDDDAAFAQYGTGYADRGEWRRDNVNKLIREVQTAVRESKPWVKFGVSPFGIWRNQKSSPEGSRTNGLQNYDELYADILKWVNEGWIDYNIPQIYWEIGHPAADYAELVGWWAEKASNRPLFIGQDVMRTVKHADLQDPTIHQQAAKMKMQRKEKYVGGSCQWPASAVVENVGNYRSMLTAKYHRYPSLQPSFSFIDDKTPRKVRKLKDVWTSDGLMLFWTAPKVKKTSKAKNEQDRARIEMDKARQYVVYRFAKGEKVDLNQASHIVAITNQTHYLLPYKDGKKKYTYVVTALDRLQNESKAVKKKVKL